MSIKETINHKLTIRDRMLKSGNMKLLNELFGDDGSQSVTRLIARHGKPQLVDVESVGIKNHLLRLYLRFTQTIRDW